jgi:hypothetical protein
MRIFPEMWTEHHVPVLELHPEHRVGEGLDDLPLHLDRFFLGHVS